MVKSELSKPFDREALVRYNRLGRECEHHGATTTSMTRVELIAFIGFLDELATERLGYVHKYE